MAKGSALVVTTPDFYGELGLDPSASADDIRRAFRRLAAENDPLAVTHLSEEQRRASARRTEHLLAAFKVLISETDRLLYDQCLAKGYDFERVHTLVVAESEADHQAQAQEARRTLEEVVADTAHGLAQAIRDLDPSLRWSPGDTAEYFDAALEGAAHLRLVRVRLKILPTIEPEAVAGILAYARQLLEVTQAGLTQVSDAFLLVGSTLLEPAQVEAAALDFNLRHWSQASPRKPRAFLAYATAADERLAIPGVDDPVPDLRGLDL